MQKIQSLKRPKFLEDNDENIKIMKLSIGYNELYKIILQDQEKINSKINGLKKLAKQTKNILQKINNQKNDSIDKTVCLQRQISSLEEIIYIRQNNQQINESNKQNANNQTTKNLERLYFEKCLQRITYANKLSIKKLGKLKIQDRRSQAHEPFIWVLTTFYGELQSKYYWPNFKNQVFGVDKGEDFKERLGKINAVKSRYDQRNRTQMFIKNYQRICKCHQLKQVTEQIQLLKNIAIGFLQCYQIGKKLQTLQKQGQKTAYNEKQEEINRHKARLEAMKERVELHKTYYSVLQRYQEQLLNKSQNYEMKANIFDEQLKRISENTILLKKSMNKK